MIKNNVVLDATLSVLVMFKDHPKMVWRYEIGKRIIQQAHETGVLIDAGSDSDQSTFVQHELKLLVNECSFIPLDAIKAATKYSAMATGILEREGTIEVGKKANLLFLDANPIEDIQHLNDVFW